MISPCTLAYSAISPLPGRGSATMNAAAGVKHGTGPGAVGLAEAFFLFPDAGNNGEDSVQCIFNMCVTPESFPGAARHAGTAEFRRDPLIATAFASGGMGVLQHVESQRSQ